MDPSEAAPPGTQAQRPETAPLGLRFDPLRLQDTALETQLLVTSVRYALLGAASALASVAESPALQPLREGLEHAGGQAVPDLPPFLLHLVAGCAAGVAARFAVWAALGRAGGCSGPPAASSVLRSLSRASVLGAVQLAAFESLAQVTAVLDVDGLGPLAGQLRGLLAGCAAGAASVVLSRPLDAALRRGLLVAARSGSGALGGEVKPAAIMAAADAATVVLVEGAAALAGLEPVYWV